MANEPNHASWFTAKRLRAQGLVLSLCSWSIYVWDISAAGLRDRNGLIKGTDFVHLYTLGLLALARRGADLYNMESQTALVQRILGVPNIVYLPLYPPQVSIFFAPLARLSYGCGLVISLAVVAVNLCLLLLRVMANVSKSTERQIDNIHSCCRLSCLLPFDTLGTDLRPRPRVF